MKVLKSLFVTALILLLSCSPVFAKTLAQEAETSVVSCSSSQGTVSLIAISGNQTIFNIPNVPWIKGETVRLAMLNAQSVNPNFTFKEQFSCPFGNLVTQIGNVMPNPANNFWALYINDKFSARGIDTAVLQKGDKIKWLIQP